MLQSMVEKRPTLHGDPWRIYPEVVMRVFKRSIIVFVVVVAAIPAMAGNIGFLDTDGVIKTVKEGRRQLEALNAWANQKSDEVEAVRDRVARLNQQLNSQRAVASADAIRQLEKDLLQAQRNLEDAARVLKAEFDGKQDELLTPVAVRVRDVATEYAEANGFDAIFPLDEQPLVYVAKSAVITDAVIRLYDERYPVD